jgi:hypothetical protein
MGFFKILTFVGAGLGSLLVAASFGMPGAAQQGAAAAVGLFMVAMPYCVHGVLHRSKGPKG